MAVTPGRLRLYSLSLTGLLALLGTALFATTLIRLDALNTIRNQAGRSIVDAQRVHAALSDADATAAAEFFAPVTVLTSNGTPADERAIHDRNLRTAAGYDTSIATAAETIQELTRLNLDATAEKQLAVLARQLPVYTGLVERARDNNRAGNSSGEGYLRKGSQVMWQQILPAADRITALNADRLDHAYQDATSGTDEDLLILAFTVTAAGLAATQLMLFRRTKRILNLPLVAASACVLIGVGWSATAFSTQQARLADARDASYTPMTLLAQSRVFALRARVDESLSLIAFGNDAQPDADFTTAINQLGFEKDGGQLPEGSLVQAIALDGPDVRARPGIRNDLQEWLAIHHAVTESLATPDKLKDAVTTSLGRGTETFDRLDRALDGAVTDSQNRFTRQVSDAAEPLHPLPAVVVITTIVAIGLGLAGIQRRINEYR